MLGRTAGGLYWMFRYLERSENTARLVETAHRISLTRSTETTDEWTSLVDTAAARDAFLATHDDFARDAVVDFLLRDPQNPSSVRSVIDVARHNAREVRTALTREVWEATNDCWHQLSDALSRPIPETELPRILALIRQESALVRGALHGTMMRNDIYNFARLGTFVERADNTARILDVKYYVLLPSPLHVGSPLDNAQWETILRSLSAQRSYHWQSGGTVDAQSIAQFIILDPRMPRSLAFCHNRIAFNLAELAYDYGEKPPSTEQAERLRDKIVGRSIGDILRHGLHDFLRECIAETNHVASQIEIDYRFTE